MDGGCRWVSGEIYLAHGNESLTQADLAAENGALVEGILPLKGYLKFANRYLGLQRTNLVIIAGNTEQATKPGGKTFS